MNLNFDHKIAIRFLFCSVGETGNWKIESKFYINQIKEKKEKSKQDIKLYTHKFSDIGMFSREFCLDSGSFPNSYLQGNFRRGLLTKRYYAYGFCSSLESCTTRGSIPATQIDLTRFSSSYHNWVTLWTSCAQIPCLTHLHTPVPGMVTGIQLTCLPSAELNT